MSALLCISVGCAGQMCKMCTTVEEIKRRQMLFVWGGGSVGAADVLSYTTAAPCVSPSWSNKSLKHIQGKSQHACLQSTRLLFSILIYFHTRAKPTSPSASIYKYSLCTLALIWAVTSETDTWTLPPLPGLVCDHHYIYMILAQKREKNWLNQKPPC